MSEPHCQSEASLARQNDDHMIVEPITLQRGHERVDTPIQAGELCDAQNKEAQQRCHHADHPFSLDDIQMTDTRSIAQPIAKSDSYMFDQGVRPAM